MENPTRVALGFLVAVTAVGDGHDVDVFVAGDGVSALRVESAEALVGVGTGSVAEHVTKLRDGGAGLYASKMSAAARGLTADDLQARGFTPAPPNTLVELIERADRTVTY